MILARSAGRLGNQLFQLAFLLTERRPRERLWAYDFNEVASLLDLSGLDWHRIPRRGRWSNLPWNRLLFPALGGLCALRLCGEVAQVGRAPDREPRRAAVLRRPGFLPLRLVQKDYYQTERLVRIDALTRYPIRAPLREQADVELARQLTPGHTPVALHLRRGDYLGTAFNGSVGDSVLPLDYYHRAIARIEKIVPAPHYFILGDSPDYAATAFRDLPRKTISRQNAETDFALMSRCRAAILSNSTFAWWAATYMIKPAALLAPQNWLGYGTDREIPESILSPRFEALPSTSPL